MSFNQDLSNALRRLVTQGSGITPLHIAASRNDADTVRVLLNIGVDVNATTVSGIAREDRGCYPLKNQPFRIIRCRTSVRTNGTSISVYIPYKYTIHTTQEKNEFFCGRVSSSRPSEVGRSCNRNSTCG